MVLIKGRDIQMPIDKDNPFRKGDKIKYTNPSGAIKKIREHKVYTVLDSSWGSVSIVNDNGSQDHYKSKHFEFLGEDNIIAELANL